MNSLIRSPRQRRASSEGGTSRPSALAVLIADWSGLVDLVDGNDGKRAGPTRVVHAGHGIDGLTDLCDGETWRGVVMRAARDQVIVFGS